MSSPNPATLASELKPVEAALLRRVRDADGQTDPFLHVPRGARKHARSLERLGLVVSCSLDGLSEITITRLGTAVEVERSRAEAHNA